MTFPKDIACFEDVCGDSCVTGCAYNTGKSRMKVNLLNQNMVEIATVVYDLDGDTGTVSLAYTDEDGNAALEEIYSGELVGKEYRYVISYNMTDAVNTFSICEGDSVVAQTEAPLGIVNRDTASKTFVQYYNIVQNKSSKAVYSRVDNIGISFLENALYKGFVEDMAAIELPDTVREDFELPVQGMVNESSISWESSDTAYITIDGATARVNRGVEEDVTVTLTATISDGVFNVSSDFNVIVKTLKGEFTDRYDITEIIADGNVNAKTTLTNVGTTGASKVSMVAVSYKNGEIFDRDICEREVTSEYGSLDFEVNVAQGDAVKYYFWDENNVPVVNHAPHIYVTSFEDKIQGAVVKWEKAYDDFGAVETYRIERSDGKMFVTDGEVIEGGMLKFFDSEATTNSSYIYKLVAVDTNQKESEAVNGIARRLEMPYSMNLNATYSQDGSYDGGNYIAFLYKSDPDRAAYTEHRTYNGEECVFVPNGKYAAFTTDLSGVFKDVAVRFTYASAVDTKLKFMYNGKQPDGSFAEVSETAKVYPATDGWQTVDFILDKEFRTTNTFSGAHFGLGCTSTGGVYIKKVEFSMLEDYE